jgi:hypothetical protein
MKIEQRGFGITDIGARVTGIDVENGGLRIAFVANVAGDEALTPPLDADDVKALIEALTAAHGLMTGEAPVPGEIGGVSVLTDKAGDNWYRIADTNRYVMSGDGRTPEYIRRNYGLHD